MKKFRLTHMQEAMLYEALASSRTRYVTVLRYELSESIDAERLRQRVNKLSERHEALRTSFTRDAAGVIWQEVADYADIDLSAADSFTDEQARISPFEGKLFKIILCPGELIVIFHHVLLDGWSVGIIMRELLAEEEPSGMSSPFRYYAKWLGKRNNNSDLAWWKIYLDGVGVCSELPNTTKATGMTTREERPHGPPKYERREVRFTIENSGLLRQRARKLRITAGRIVQAVWCMLIARYNGGESLVCTVISGRSAPVPGITEMVGMCVNTLPIVTKLPKPPDSVTFADWIYEWNRQTTEAEKHGFSNLGDIISGPLPHILAIDPSFNGEGYRLKSSNAELVTDFDAAFTLDDTIMAEFAYNAYVYTNEAVKAIRSHFLTALYAVMDNPQIKIENIPILTSTEIAELTALNENIKILDIIEHQTVVDFWRESVKEHGNRTALVCGNVRLTYSELSDTVNRLSAALKARGVGAETPVSLVLSRSERYVIAELAVMAAGGMFIPLDPEWPDDRIKTIMDETKPYMVIDDQSFTELLTSHEPLSSTVSPMPQDAAYMIMTSGTTGIPKGVVITHRNLANFCLWTKERYGWQPGDSCALELGFTFDGSMWDIWLPLISGGTLHILSDDVRFSIGALGTYCRSEHITHIDLPVTMAGAFREIYRGENALPDLRVMVTGGEEVRRVIPAAYLLSNEYGPTECTVCCSVGWVSGESYPITVGAPPPNMNAYVLDSWGRLCPDGVAGEAAFSGVQVARGYYNAPDLTEKRFTNNPFAGDSTNHKVLYRSGDMMKWIKRGGSRELVFMGRADKQVKINGYRIELGEIENVLCSHKAVNAAAAVVKETGEKRICAYVAPNSELDISELYRLISSKLPSFMHPIIFLVDKIPLTSSGKVDAERLSLFETEIIAESAMPETENEKALVSVVSRMLGVSNIGINHNYLELGGNSINAMRIAFYLEGEGFELSAKELITSGNLTEAATKMRPIAPTRKNEYEKNTFQPLSAQQAMIFLNETESSAMYTVTLTLDAAELDMGTLRKRLDKAAELHDILRATFERGDTGRIIGCVHDTHRIPLNSDDFDATKSIDPLGGSLLSLKLYCNKLTIRYHHVALDGLSVNLLINELLFNKFPEIAPSFAEFANRLAAQAKRQTDDEAWWRMNCQNAGIVPLFSPKPTESPEYDRIEICPPELLAKCADAAKAARVTPAAFMLTAWGVVLNVLSAEDDGILIPFAASCRDDDKLMGMCAAAHPLKFSITGETFGGLSRNVQAAMLESISHWFVPQDIIGRLPGYLFVFEDGTNSFNASGDQNYDLVIKFSSNGELIYNTACVTEELAHEIAARINASLMSALNDRVSVFRECEYELVTKTFACGRFLAVKYPSVAAAFAAAAHTYADRAALETEDQLLTYTQLYERAKSFADELHGKGFGAGDIVAFSLNRNAEGIIAQIGIALLGAAFLPLDPAWPEGRLNSILQDSGAVAVIKSGLTIELTGAESNAPTDSAYVIYTSGTTGKPKGVILTHSALINQITWAIDEFGFCAADKMLHYIAFTFDPSIWVIFTALLSGARLLLLSEDERLNPDAVAQRVKEQDVTICTLPAAVAPDILQRVKNSGLRTVFLGGETIKKLSLENYGFEIVNCYGPTETCINAAFYRLPSGESETRNIGQPVANTNCYVLDAHGEPCPIGIQGELCIGGAQLAHGYLNRHSESEAVFTEHPRFGRIYKTGDRAAWNSDGTLAFLGRTDSQVKIRGNRVELLEIEHVLRGIPGISDAKVKLSNEEIYAYVIYENGAPTLTVAAVGQWLSERLPSYMLPRAVTVMESFPLTGNGKVDFAALPVVTANVAAESAEPLSETEKNIADAWKTALRLEPEFRIGRLDSFYDLGGHSLLLFHVVGLLSASGISADIRMLIKYPILADLAEAISGQKIIQSPKASMDFMTNSEAYKLYVRKMEKIELSEKRPLSNILITGGTGFLGSHLVREFFINSDAAVYLPVRGGINKLWDALNYYFGEQGTEMAASKRIRAYLSDVSEKPPDIDVPLDAIFHTAADIRHYAPEPEMYRANVTATENMLALAARHPNALFAHISTTSAVNAPFICETDTDLGPAFDNVYQRTKQLAEQLVLDAGKHGLKYAVFRVGHVSPGFEGGSVARNWEINAMLRLINAMLLTKLLPEQDYAIGYGYVDKTAMAVRLLSQPVNLEGLVFHIDNPKTLRLSELFRLAGLAGEVLPKSELVSRLRQLMYSEDETIIQAASEYLGRLSQGSLEKDSSDIVAGKLSMDATLLLLKRLGFEWPHVTEEYMKNIVSALIQNSPEWPGNAVSGKRVAGQESR